MPGWLKNVITVVTVLIVTAVLWPFAETINHTTVALALLLAILFIATGFGRRRALAASILAILCFNFFFLPPFYTFTITHPENWVAFAAFLITALVAGQLSSYARRRADEAELQRVEIEKLYRELQEAFEQASEAEALRRSEKLKSSLLDAVTHDLRTPLTSIKASATSLLEDKKEKFLDDEAETEFLEIINEETDRLNDFIEGMVGLAKIEARKMHVRKALTPVRDVIDSAIARARTQLDTFTIEIGVASEVPEVFVDAGSVSEVIYSLLDNAAKYAPRGSRIRVTATRVSDTIEIAVEDEGPGIPEEMRERVFEKFVRMPEDAIPSTASGLGLGLAIARGIVESQNGTIRVENGSDGFVTKVVFTLSLEGGRE